MKYYKVFMFYKGEQIEFIIKSFNKAEAIIDAKKTNQGILVKIEEIPMPFNEKLNILKDMVSEKVLRKKINYPSYIGSLRQISVMIKAGISLKDGLKDIGENTKDRLVKELFLKSAEAIDSGKTLSDVFMDYQQYIGGISLALIRLGEQTGDLAASLDYLADIYENMYENRKKMVKALRYPVITLIAIVVAFVILIMMVVPKFKSIFEQLHAQLPLPTKILLGTEYVLSHYGMLVFLIIFAIIFAIIFFYKTSKDFKYKADAVLLKTYLIKDIIRYATLHRFLLILSSLLSSGVPLVESLKISEGIVENEVIKKKIFNIRQGINQGRSFAEMLKEADLVNFIALRMISAGEESGELDTMLKNAASYYEDRFQSVIDNMQAAIEPIMLTVIGGLVLLLALGIFLPMWNLAQAAHAGG